MRFIRPLYIYIFEAYTQRAITYIDLVRNADLRIVFSETIKSDQPNPEATLRWFWFYDT